MSLLDEIHITAAVLERNGNVEAAKLLDVAYLRLTADMDDGQGVKPADDLGDSPMGISPMGDPGDPGDGDAGQLPPGTILMLQDSGETVVVESFDGQVYRLSNGLELTEEQITQLAGEGKVSVLSPEAEEASDVVYDAADEVAPVEAPTEPSLPMANLLASAATELIIADLTGEMDPRVADFFNKHVEAPVLSLPAQPKVSLPGKIKSIVDKAVSSHDERPYHVLKEPDGTYCVCFFMPHDDTVKAIIQEADNAGIAVAKGPSSQGWETIDFPAGEYSDDQAVPAVMTGGDEVEATDPAGARVLRNIAGNGREHSLAAAKITPFSNISKSQVTKPLVEKARQIAKQKGDQQFGFRETKDSPFHTIFLTDPGIGEAGERIDWDAGKVKGEQHLAVSLVNVGDIVEYGSPGDKVFRGKVIAVKQNPERYEVKSTADGLTRTVYPKNIKTVNDNGVTAAISRTAATTAADVERLQKKFDEADQRATQYYQEWERNPNSSTKAAYRSAVQEADRLEAALVEAKKSVVSGTSRVAWGVTAAISRTADDGYTFPQAPATPETPATPSTPAQEPAGKQNRDDASLIYFRRPDGAVFHIPLVVIQKALEQGYGGDLKKLIGKVVEAHIWVPSFAGYPGVYADSDFGNRDREGKAVQKALAEVKSSLAAAQQAAHEARKLLNPEKLSTIRPAKDKIIAGFNPLQKAIEQADITLRADGEYLRKLPAHNYPKAQALVDDLTKQIAEAKDFKSKMARGTTGSDIAAIDKVLVSLGASANPNLPAGSSSTASAAAPRSTSPLQRTAIIKRCEAGDGEAGKPWCLYTADGSRLLGRHPNEESARRQEEAIKSRGG